MQAIPLWKAIFLGVVQGITEFLPVSSSAHLVIFQQFLNLGHDGAFLMAFDVALHFGTLAALVTVFLPDLKWILKESAGRRIGLYVILATIPAALVGFLLKNFFETLFGDTISASFFLILTGWILWWTQKAKPASLDLESMTPKEALGIGFAQAVAILPGISRSGSTIAAGILLKLKPEAAVRFSFLMAIPAIGGAALVEFHKFAAMNSSVLLPLLAGVVVAFFSGLSAIRWMLKFIEGGKLYFFSWYCWIFGGFVFIKELFL